MILAIESASTDPSVAVLADDGELLHLAAWSSTPRQAHELLPRLLAGLAEAGGQMVDVTAIGIGLGPGSFTGLRVGMSLAKGLAFALGCPVFGVPSLEAWLAADRPYLGICLGLQLLFDGSDEDGAATFGVLSGRTQRLEDAPTIPHVGWNQVVRRRAHPLFDGLAPDADFYFVHSYAGRPVAEARELVLAETTHGATFVSAVARGNTWGVQFHPERSADNGLRLLANAVALAARAIGVSAPSAAEAFA